MTLIPQRLIVENTFKVGLHFRKVRTSMKLTMREVAQRMTAEGFPCVHSTISKIEYGQRRIEVVEYLLFCKVYRVNPMQTLALLLPDITDISHS